MLENILKRRIIILLNFSSIIFLNIPILSKEYNKIISYSSFITLTIKGPSISKIFYDNSQETNNVCPKTIFPDEININDISFIISTEYNFTEPKNIVKLTYYNNLKNLNCMFLDCQNITEIDFSNFNSSEITACGSMFQSCLSLTSINFTNFNVSKVKEMQRMFQDCKALKSIDLSNFNTLLLEKMEFMFYNCILLTSLDLSKFDTSKVKNMESIFHNCYALTSIDISNFNFRIAWAMAHMFINCNKLQYIEFPKSYTNNLHFIGSMFKNCISLISLDLSYFITTKVKHMDFVFYNCRSLTSLDLSNFDTSSVTWIESMFDLCTNLKYLNFKNLKENEGDFKYDNMFNETPDNIIICIDENIAPNIFQLINNKIYLSELKNCKLTCNNNVKHIHQYNYKYYGKCSNIYNNNDDGNNLICKSDEENFLLYAKIENNFCVNCSNLFNIEKPNIDNIEKYINCSDKPDGYYLNETINNNYIYKLCFERCKTCEIQGNNINHNCLLCNNYFPFYAFNNNYFNCYNNCTYYLYYDKNANIYYCTNDSFCPKEYNKLIREKNECLKKCTFDNEYKYDFKNICYKKCPEKTVSSSDYNKYSCETLCNDTYPFLIIETQECVDYCDIPKLISELCKVQYEYIDPEENEEIDKGKNIQNKEIKKQKEQKEIKAQDHLIKNVEKSLTSDTYNTSNLEKGEDDKINIGKMTITLTTTKNQNNSYNNTETNINLGNCENILYIKSSI